MEPGTVLAPGAAVVVVRRQLPWQVGEYVEPVSARGAAHYVRLDGVMKVVPNALLRPQRQIPLPGGAAPPALADAKKHDRGADD